MSPIAREVTRSIGLERGVLHSSIAELRTPSGSRPTTQTSGSSWGSSQQSKSKVSSICGRGIGQVWESLGFRSHARRWHPCTQEITGVAVVSQSEKDSHWPYRQFRCIHPHGVSHIKCIEPPWCCFPRKVEQVVVGCHILPSIHGRIPGSSSKIDLSGIVRGIQWQGRHCQDGMVFQRSTGGDVFAWRVLTSRWRRSNTQVGHFGSMRGGGTGQGRPRLLGTVSCAMVWLQVDLAVHPLKAPWTSSGARIV